MKTRLASLVGVLFSASLLLYGCGQAAPAPAPPTKAPEPTKAQAVQATAAPVAQPTAAPAAQPTAAPAVQPTAAPPKVDYPQKGKTVSLIVPWGAGGSTDVMARMLGAEIEKQFGMPVEIVNKAGGNSQLGLTDLVKAKADGYTFGSTNLPTTALTYLDPARQAPYGRKDFPPLGNLFIDPTGLAVASWTPWKTLPELVAALKASPGKIRVGILGIGGDDHMDVLRFEKITGTRFATVGFDTSQARNAAMIGQNIETAFGGVGALRPTIVSGDTRLLAVLDKQENALAPGVKTMEAQGYQMYSVSSRGYSAPAGVPKDIVAILSAAIKKASETQAVKNKIAEFGLTLRYEDAETYVRSWDVSEAGAKESLTLLKDAVK